DKFIIVCRRRGLQMGMMIERVHTMYRVPQQDIDWAIEAHLGISVDFVSGLLKADERLVSIVSVDKILDCVLKR
ncbi:MAG TPA: chemotaxis protein CheW, partial [Desulfovibrio sp.]|nr:chemotaxis protein CheW [Desulfovibrio sp.]